MLMKSHKFVGAYFAAILFLLIAACSANNTVTTATFQNAAATKVVAEKAARTLDCRNANGYSFVIVENPNRKKDTDPVMPRDVNIVAGDEVISKIELPIADSEAKNFSLNSVEKTKVGFEIKVDWGGGLYFYEIQFNFRCKESDFYLYRVKKVSFSTTNPDRGFWDKKESKVTKIEPNLPIEKFVMIDYL
jgi:hypothetical protein